VNAASAIEVRRVAKIYVSAGRAVHAIEDATFDVPDSAFVSLVGPSGCGKSTLLKMIGGLDRATSGEIRYRGERVEALNRDIGYVPQNDQLLPWRSVAGNVAIGLEFRRRPVAEVRARVDALLRLVGLTAFAHHHPSQLSGGMRKRVSLVRAFAYSPRCLLMDEPFGALDAQMKSVLQRELLKIWEGGSQTIVFVTHDIEEAILLSDLIVVMSKPPSVIKAVERVELARPRDLQRDKFEPAFRALYARLWSLIDQDLAPTERG
jgi:NitT/TauT family transport system ATP-binding protein